MHIILPPDRSPQFVQHAMRASLHVHAKLGQHTARLRMQHIVTQSTSILDLFLMAIIAQMLNANVHPRAGICVVLRTASSTVVVAAYVGRNLEFSAEVN